MSEVSSNLETAEQLVGMTKLTDALVMTPGETPTPQVDPNEEAAKKFTELLPYVKKFCNVMSSKSITRVMFAMAEFPLGASKPRLINAQEQQLFHVLQELNGAKSIVISTILKQNAELEKLKQTALEGSNAEQEITDGNANSTN